MTSSGLGIIGIEFANIFNALLELRMPSFWSVATWQLLQETRNGYGCRQRTHDITQKVMEKATVEEFTYVPLPGNDEEFIQMKLNDGTAFETDLFFSAIGRYPIGKDETMGLDSAGVEVADRGMVNVDKKTFETSSKNVYAAGDVIGAPALASMSMEYGTSPTCCVCHVQRER